MKRFKAGSLYCFGETPYYTDDFRKFFYENDEELSEEDLNEWAITLNSPWSQATFDYTISLNCKDAYTEMDENDPMWKCEYNVVSYDDIAASAIGYGLTEAFALECCRKMMNHIQGTWNPEDVSF